MKQPTHMIENDKSSDLDSGGNVEKTRTRGKKRKGRKDTSDAVDEKQKENSSSATNGGKRSNGDGEDKLTVAKRRCIGRKPVTDFVIGKYYTGSIVYIKQFGLFLDIGCHSDAFCHVSRVSDGFVETIESVHKVGDVVSARVIDVNRTTKRITVSMQSEERAADELDSVNAWKLRSEKRHNKQNNSAIHSSSSSTSFASDKPIDHSTQTTTAKTATTEINGDSVKIYTPDDVNIVPAQQTSSNPTRDELKRARKIARRAERRANLQSSVP
jgi:predicted RNA-binding protein with RPS1 domain